MAVFETQLRLYRSVAVGLPAQVKKLCLQQQRLGLKEVLARLVFTSTVATMDDVL